LDYQGDELNVWVPPEAKHTFRQRFKLLARHEKRRAADAGNAANTSQLLGGSIGGALATSGVIALATASGPLAIAAVIATGVGALIAAGGLLAGHWMNKKKYLHEERLERYLEVVEELK
jgi:lysozyme family protein